MNVTRGYGFLEGFLSRKRAEVTDGLIPAVARKGRILDIGCGSTPYFLRSIVFKEKYGLDKVHETEVIEMPGEKIFIKRHDVENENRLPFEDDYFDVVAMLAVFEHITPHRLVTLLKEINRVMKPGGRYILTTPAAWADILLRILARFALVSREEIDEHKDRYSHKKIKGILMESGFADSRICCGYFEGFMNIWVSVSK